jgi:UrcA family protein
MNGQRIPARRIELAVLLGVALSACGLSSTAVAEEPVVTRVELRVTASGLDLTTAAGASTFLERLNQAAKTACGDHGKLAELPSYKTCYDQAIVDAVRTVNQPLLVQAYVARYPNEAAQFGMRDDRSVASPTTNRPLAQ